MTNGTPPLNEYAGDPTQQQLDQRAHDFRQILRHGLVYLPSRVVPGLAGLLTIVALTRLLGAAGYGRFTLLVITGAYTSVLLSEWIVYAFQRFHLSEGDWTTREAAEEAQAWRIIVLAVGTTTISLVALLLGFEWRAVIAVAVLTSTNSWFVMVAITLTLSEESAKYTSLQVAVSLSKLLLVILATVLTRSPEAAAAVTGCAIAIPVYLFVRGQRRVGWRRPKLRTLRVLARFGLPMLLMSSGLNVVSTADRYIVAYIRGEAEAGRYAAAYLLGEQSIILLSSVLFLSTYPRVVMAWEEGRRSDAGVLASRAGALHLQLVMPFVVALAVGGGVIARLLLGSEFAGETILGIVGFAAALLAVSQYANLGLQMRQRPGRIAALAGGAAVLNIGLCFVLIPSYGQTGAAVATLIAYVFLVVVSVGANRGFFRSGILVRQNASFAVLGFAVWLASLWLPRALYLCTLSGYLLLAGISLTRKVVRSFVDRGLPGISGR